MIRLYKRNYKVRKAVNHTVSLLLSDIPKRIEDAVIEVVVGLPATIDKAADALLDGLAERFEKTIVSIAKAINKKIHLVLDFLCFD